MSALKGSATLRYGRSTKVTFRASDFHAPEGWGYWVAEKDGFEVSVRANGSASIDRYDDKSYFNIDPDFFPKELSDGTKGELEYSLNLPYDKNHEEEE